MATSKANPESAETATSRSAADLESLANQQGVTPIDRFEDILGDFWPDDEDADHFLRAVRRWRREGTPEVAECPPITWNAYLCKVARADHPDPG